MSSWNFTDVGFDNMLEDPSWAFSHLPLNNSSEFILEAPKEGEEEFETIPLDDMYDGDDEDSNEEDLDDLLLQLEQAEEQERLAHENYSRAKDSEQPNSLSNSSDYSQESSFNLQCPPSRMNISSNIRQTTFVIGNNYEFEQRGKENAPRISEVPRRKNRAPASLLKLDLPSPIDFGKVFSPETSETMDNDFVPNMLEGFETMNFGELIQDYESSDILHPTKAQKFRCDIETPAIFSMEPHWFHDTKYNRCWCIHCIQYRKTQSTGEQMEAHDFNYRCLCSSCSELYHEALPKGQSCNCSSCTNVNKDEDPTDQNKALAELQKQIQLQSPELRNQDSEQLVTDTSQKSLSDPPCKDKESTTVASESVGGPSELLNMIRENLWLDSDCDTVGDFDEE
ncbi:uncharacterized protein EAE97_003556 [Botrytis byssoidea]|uniref:Uncharacterized protein n=1 Tax=Botrytis byssoidea TaxID=139641 RepID=A0A9P5IQZ0_9HELO|nr:uncharacterized protein EAE97_003556 [Botrytis byssoidea]KAF7948145.1 hypothetical protein EAE97_003556 [Botrytis byssoidea]